jgi:hypothetical protein
MDGGKIRLSCFVKGWTSEPWQRPRFRRLGQASASLIYLTRITDYTHAMIKFRFRNDQSLH